jgi:two-component system sensor histidine kinase ChvG
VSEGNSAATESIARIEHAIRRLDALISAARRIDEAMAELLEPDRREIDLAAMLPALADDYRDLGSKRQVRIRVDVEDGLVTAANGGLLEAAIENVLENALDFAPPDSDVILSANADNGAARIRVEDQGPGIRDGEDERIFERHFSTREADGVNGNFGIGLWVVRRNIEVMGGSAIAGNTDGGGFRVEIRLPLVAA